MNGPDFVHQFEVLASGVRRRAASRRSNILDPWEQGRDYFAQGQLAMVITDFQDLRQGRERGHQLRLDRRRRRPTGVEPYFFVWTDSVGVMADSDNPEEAKDFIAFLTTEGQQIRYETSGDIPLDLAVAEEVDWATGVPGREDGLEVLSHARPLVFVPNRWDVVGPYYDAWGFVLGGEKTAQEALDDAAPAIQENLDKAWEDWEEPASRHDATHPPPASGRRRRASARRTATRGRRWHGSEGVDGAEGAARRLPLPVAVADRARRLLGDPDHRLRSCSASASGTSSRPRSGSGFENYREMLFDDRTFWVSIRVTLKYMVLSVPAVPRLRAAPVARC